MSDLLREIFLDKEGDSLDGIFKKLTENAGNLSAEFRFIEEVEIVVPADSQEAKILKEKLTDDFRGRRILVYKTDDPKKPLIVVEKRNNHCNNPPIIEES